ncbi:DUF2339 domain-containing protein [Maricurvus nonylphenolicus]|uniref:DUF2339 domain-containing protein n=1 Tax=Maricurvus nonylphenolicus TaxID=1008307 RepID=UPI0036F28F45
MDEGFFVLLGLVVLAVPFAVVYLLVRVSNLGREVETLRNRLAILDQARQSYVKVPAPESRSEPKSEPEEEIKPQSESVKPSASVTTEPSPIEVAAAEPSTPQATESPALNLDLSLDAEEDKPKTSPLERGINWLTDTVKSYFTEGNLIVRVGVIVLFFGVAFLLRYAAENSMLPIELRIAGVALGGIALLVTGWRLRLARKTYALVMQGGGVGILYLTLFASLRLYELLPAGLVFGLLLVMVVLSALLAIWQDARSLAILAVSGGFLAPVLTSTGEGSHIALFSFYAVLNAGIVFIAAFKHWRLLNLVGFGFTFVIASFWGVDRYHEADYLSCQIFLILFFLFYAIIGTLFARGHTHKQIGYVDGSLVFGLPLVAFSLQAALVKDMEYGLAWSAFALGLFYLGLTRYLWQRMGDSMRLLLESYLALGVLFATLVIPFALDGEWIATAWALEGAAVAWVSIRQQRQLGTAFALSLQLIAGVAFLIEQHPSYDAPAIINSVYMSALFVAVAGLFSSYYLYRHFVETGNTAAWQSKVSLPFLVWAVLWWLGSGIQEIHRVLGVTEDAVSLVFFAVTAVGFRALAERVQWRPVYFSPHGLIGMVVLFALYTVADLPQPFAEGFAWAWPVTWLAIYGLLYRINQKAEQPLGLQWLHGLSIWSVVLVLSVFAHWLADDYGLLGNSWAWACAVIPLLAALVKILHGQFWPFRVADNGYRTLAILPLLPALVLATLIGSSINGDVTPLTYIPFMNPLDLVQVLVFIGLLRWWYQEQQSGDLLKRDPRLPMGVIALIGGLIFVWLNAVLLRSLHHYFAVSYYLEPMFNSALVQACLSVFWTLLGLALMVWSSRQQMRYAWLVAAGLIGVVVLKLFVIDLADSETLESIISFIVVGTLLLIIGYVSPIPPRQDEEAIVQEGAEEGAEGSAGASK